MNKLPKNSLLRRMDKFTQHGDTSCLMHTLAVAYYSLKLAEHFDLDIRRRELIRGAVLHDYFLYDWHDGEPERKIHGFTHSSIALKNAERDFNLTDTERNIISRHMFPLTPIPPMCREGWIVCLVDKYCSLQETFKKCVYSKKTKNADFDKFYEEIQMIFEWGV